MLLDVPRRAQRHDHDCGDAVLRSVCAYYAKRNPKLGEAGLPSPIHGIDRGAMEAALRGKGFAVQCGEMTLNDLQWQTRQGRPVICLVQHGTAGGHWVCVAGLIRRVVHIVDPADGPDREGQDTFHSRWFDLDRDGRRIEAWGIAVGLK